MCTEEGPGDASLHDLLSQLWVQIIEMRVRQPGSSTRMIMTLPHCQHNTHFPGIRLFRGLTSTGLGQVLEMLVLLIHHL